MEKAEVSSLVPQKTITPDYEKGFNDGRRYVELCMFKARSYRVLIEGADHSSIPDIAFEDSNGGELAIFEQPRKGCWEHRDLDGRKITVGAICSECHKYTQIPEKYCPKCGAQNQLGYGEG